MTFPNVFKSKFNIRPLDITKFVPVLECFKDLFRHRNFCLLHFGHRWSSHFGCANGFLELATHFLDEALSQNMVYINNFPLLRDTHVALSILFSCVTC